MNRASPRALVVAAHPDDAEFTSGGTLARWVAEGWQISLVVCTDGGKGSPDARVQPTHLARVRRVEQENSAKLLGLQEIAWFGYTDGELARAANLVERLTEIVRRAFPQRLLTWDPWKPYQLHPDHRTVGFAALDAVLAAGNPHFFPEQIETGLAPHRLEQVYLFGTNAPDEWVDITATFERKMSAIECHASQVASLRDLALKMSHCNREWGLEHGCTYAEAFKVLRPFCDT
jgi:LmbE family N-acetylglucosaminyl deacetylase